MSTPTATRGAATPAADPADPWLDAFLAAYHARRPVSATFIGVHELDDRLPDFSENGAGDTVAEMGALLRELDGGRGESADLGGAAPLSPVQELDRRLAAGFLRIQQWEFGSAHFHRGNPSLYVGEAIFGVMSLFLSDFAPLASRMESAIQRLEAIPLLLAQGRDNVRSAPTAWTERALVECGGVSAFLGGGIDLLAASDARLGPRLQSAADVACRAFADFRAYLKTELLPRGTDDVACGEEGLALLLREGHFLQATASDIVRYGEDRLEEARAYLEEHAGDLGAPDPRAALAQLALHHPTVEGYYARYQEVWDEVRRLSDEQRLITWPDFPIRYVPRPPWSRAAAPSLYFLFYRSPAPFGAPPVHDYLVMPIEPDMPAAEQQALLAANNDSVIKLNHVVHHGGIGHHVQNWHASRAASRIGRIAAVDCACRIALFCGGTMAEGWPCYATSRVGEAGGFTPLELYSDMQDRTRICARAIVDVELHRGRMTLAEAVTFYEKEAFLSPPAARFEAVRNSMYPGAALMYLMGTDGIRSLKAERSKHEGAAFDEQRFHDELLSFGSIPVSLAAERMRT